jgi:hypothetical protein
VYSGLEEGEVVGIWVDGRVGSEVVGGNGDGTTTDGDIGEVERVVVVEGITLCGAVGE